MRSLKTKEKKYLYTSVLLMVLVLIGIFCPPVLYLNDDIAMRSILSGAYTGTPDGHVVYMQYPLTAILALFYRIFPAVSWLEIFFTGCIWCCMLLLADAFENKIAGIVFVVCFFLPLYIYMHYTVVAAVVAGCAVFLLCQGKHKISALLLLWIAYMIRSQVAVLSLPFMAAALVWRVLNSEKSLKEELAAIGKYVGVLLVGLAVISGINHFCYRSEAWQEYLSYNEARTQLYDYTDFSSTDKYAREYADYGMTKEEFPILFNYYIMLDDTIDSEKLQEVADKVTAGMWSHMDAASIVKNCVEKYYHQVRFRDFPYNIIWVAAYVFLALGFVLKKKWWHLSFLGVLGAGRSLVWLYLIWKGRYPERVVLSLYIIELLLLLAMGMHMVSKRKPIFLEKSAYLAKLASICFLVACVGFGVYQGRSTWKETRACVKLQQGWMPLKAYCTANPQNNYFLDVFSIATYADIDYTSDFSNMMMIGGWLTQSPLAEERLNTFGGADAAEVLYYNDNARLVADISRDMTWLEEYLQKRFGDCELVRTNVIYCDWRAIIEYEVR